MKIIIETKPLETMRYDTWGDWYYDDVGNLHIDVANNIGQLPTENHQLLVALHEFVEVWLCKEDGVTQEQVDEFDMETYPTLLLPDDLEPGDHELAPYRSQHRKAAIIEHLMANFLNMTSYGVVK